MRYSYKKALNTVTEWAIKEGYEDISFDHNDISYIDIPYIDWGVDVSTTPKIIKIQGSHPIEIKLYLLLHELGHHQLRKNWDRFKKILPIIAYAEENRGKYKRRVTYAVSCMEEEFKAWEEGYKLGEKLGVKINLQKWNAYKSKCLISYMRHYASKK